MNGALAWNGVIVLCAFCLGITIGVLFCSLLRWGRRECRAYFYLVAVECFALLSALYNA